MNSDPKFVIDGALDRVKEIIWWNRSLTSLTDSDLFKNGAEFLRRDLLDIRGPYVEYLRQSARGETKLSELAQELALDPALVAAVQKILFSKLEHPGEGRLYAHQENALRELCSDGTSDLIITAPTSGGKTEAFLLPILQYCLTTRANGLKAILIYPMKTLATDQFNRLLKYLDVINEISEKRITIAVWDSDTPSGASSHRSSRSGFQVANRPHQRGLICPRCGADLLLTEDESLACERCVFKTVWAKSTRNGIVAAAENIDILVTNPEALEHMLTNRNLHDLLGSDYGNPPIRFIVIDEAHYWRGTAGSTMNLFARRLRKHYHDRSVRFVLASATIRDEAKFLSSLVNTPPQESKAIGFVPETVVTGNNEPDFSRVVPTDFEEILQVLLHLSLLDNTEAGLLETHPELEGALRTATHLGLISDASGTFSVNDFVMGTIRLLEELRIVSDRNDIDKEMSRITHSLLSRQAFVDSWRTYLLENSPDISALVARFELTASKGEPLVYVPESELIDFIVKYHGASGDVDYDCAREVLATCLNLGRTANLLSDKYHMFVGSPTQIFYCSDCKLLSREEMCRCGKASSELQFCSRCHTPVMLVEEVAQIEERVKDASENSVDQDDDDSPESKEDEDRLPEEKDEPVVNKVTRRVPLYDVKCRHTPKLPSVWYPSFITYLLSYMCREVGSGKVLVFSDSRRTANVIVDNFQRNDHSLVAQGLFVRELLRSKDFSLELGAIRNILIGSLREYYYDFIRTASDGDDVREFLEDYRRRVVYSKSNLYNMRQLWEGSVATPQVLLSEAKDNDHLVLGHRLFEFLYSKHHDKVKFTLNRQKFSGKTPSKYAQSMTSEFPEWPEDKVRAITFRWISLFLDEGLLIAADKNEIDEKIRNAKGIDDRAKQEILDYLVNEGTVLEREVSRRLGDSEYAILQPVRRAEELDKCVFGLVPKVGFCETCMKIWPAKETPFICPNCGHGLPVEDRIRDGLAESCEFGDVWPWRIDHWAKETIDVARAHLGCDEEIPHVFPGVHTAVAQQEIRSALERGFKSDPPRVNFISATPTLEVGVDIGNLDMIVQVGIPPTLTSYVQRCGRAGRVRGKPSFIWTILRNGNSIDNYHFEHLSEYLRELKPLYVPEPETLDMVVASEMVGELLSQLSRKANEMTYKMIMTIPEGEFSTTVDVCSRAKLIASAICDLVTDEKHMRDMMGQRFREVFGESSVFKDLFVDGNSLMNLRTSASNLFDGLGDLSAESISEYRDTRKWLGELGLFSSYRGSVNDVPVVQKKQKGRGESVSLLMLQDFKHVVSENFPGPKNSYGAKFAFEGVNYMVKRALATQKLASVKICINEKCTFRWWAYPDGVDDCPWCESKLEKRSVMRPDQIQVEPADRYGECYPVISALPQMIEESDRSKVEFFRVPTEVAYGRINCIEFTPAYRWMRSAAYVDSQVAAPVVRMRDSGMSALDSLISTGTTPEYGHIGYKLESQGMVLEFPSDAIRDLLGEREMAGVISLLQGSRLASSLAADAELSDLNAEWSSDQQKMTLFIFDTKTRGSGISRRIFRDLTSGGGLFEKALRSISNCPHCAKYCSRCLLIERTPPIYVKDGLLDRTLLKGLLK